MTKMIPLPKDAPTVKYELKRCDHCKALEQINRSLREEIKPKSS